MKTLSMETKGVNFVLIQLGLHPIDFVQFRLLKPHVNFGVVNPSINIGCVPFRCSSFIIHVASMVWLWATWANIIEPLLCLHYEKIIFHLQFKLIYILHQCHVQSALHTAWYHQTLTILLLAFFKPKSSG